MNAASAPARLLPYAKMNGIGNSILVLDARGGPAIEAEAALRFAADPRFAFDQLMAIEDPRDPGGPPFVDIFNTDGSRAGACGNGTRCVAWMLLDGSPDPAVTVETAAGLLDCRRLEDGTFTVDMGPPRLEWRDIPLRDAVADTRAVPIAPVPEAIAALGAPAAVSMGNPHAIFWLDGNAALPDLQTVGPVLERHPLFPERANISFARVLAPDHIRLDVWERGAGITRACGSAACATLVAAVRTGRSARRARVDLPGGTLTIEWRAADDHVLMSGAVELEHRGAVEASGP